MSSKDFHERFEIPLEIDEAKRRFINRANNLIFNSLFWELNLDVREHVELQIATALGEETFLTGELKIYINGDYDKCLQAIEAFYNAINYDWKLFDDNVVRILEETEIDLGIKWANGKFVKTGAKLLDEKLVNEPLRWLSDKQHETVLTPYKKGLTHFLDSGKRPELLTDVITDMYEALEALAKIVTGRPSKDLSANAELLIQKVNASETYKRLLKEYVKYANGFRHAEGEGGQRPNLSSAEVESFIYLTGIFIRLSIH